MTTLAELKAGAVLPPPVYRSKPYIVLSDEDVVLSAGTLDEVLALSDKFSSYYDDCVVEVRQHDLAYNDNRKFVADRSDAVDLETAITKAVAEMFGFVLRDTHAKCGRCGWRLMYRYVGMPLNERMILHARGHGVR